jgi:hypothetical protein
MEKEVNKEFSLLFYGFFSYQNAMVSLSWGMLKLTWAGRQQKNVCSRLHLDILLYEFQKIIRKENSKSHSSGKKFKSQKNFPPSRHIKNLQNKKRSRQL